MGTVLNFCDRAMLLNMGGKVAEGDTENVMQEYSLVNIGVLEKRNEKDKKNNAVQIFKEENEGKKRWGSGEVTISSVKIFQKDENNDKDDRSVLISGSAFIFRINFNKNKEIEEIVLGLGIHFSENDQYCFALNTYLDRIRITSEQIEQGFIEVEIPSLLLNDGEYYINAIVGDKYLNFNSPVDFVNKIKTFTVKNKIQREGLFNIDHNWR